MRRFRASLLQFNPFDRIPTLFALGMLIGAVWYLSVGSELSIPILLFGVGLAALLFLS